MLETMPLRHVADVRVSNVDKKSVEGEAAVRLCNYTDVYYSNEIRDDRDFMAATATRSQIERFRLAVGDTIVTKDSETADDIAVPAYVAETADDLVCGYHLALFRPRVERVEPRFLAWAIRSDFCKEQFSVSATGVTRYGLKYEAMLGVSVPTPPIDAQRRIADFLDEQVSRIDEAVRLRRDQIEALERRVAVAADVALTQRGWMQPTSLEAEAVQTVPDGWRVAQLSQVLRQLTNGYVGATRDILMDEGVPYIQSMHIKRGAIDFDRRHFFVSEAWHAARPRIHLRESDVLIVQTGDIGRVAVVPPDFGEASCHALQIARVHKHVLSGEYLGAFLGSSFGYHSLLSRATGALHPHLEGGIRSVPVVIPPHDVQRAVVVEVNAYCLAAREGQALMEQQILLLEERKRSLITAAVTGEFDVTIASGRGI